MTVKKGGEFFPVVSAGREAVEFFDTLPDTFDVHITADEGDVEA